MVLDLLVAFIGWEGLMVSLTVDLVIGAIDLASSLSCFC